MRLVEGWWSPRDAVSAARILAQMSRRADRTSRARRSRWSVVLLSIAGLVGVAAVVGVAVLGAGWVVARLDDGSTSSPRGGSTTSAVPEPVPATPLASFDTSGLVIERGDFCSRVSLVAVMDALGAEPTRDAAYGNGARVRLGGDVRDVTHEFGCRFGVGRREVAGWVFVPPVTVERARDYVAEARAEEGCEPMPDAPAFGRPSVAVRCSDAGETPGVTQVRFAGLFGDSWLSCSLQQPTADGGDGDAAPDSLIIAAGRWCVAVATAATAPTPDA